jgi:release factor glutamine methyltransferase
LIPRPETELICDTVIKLFKDKNPHILDIGTGTGCILLSILSEIKKAKGIGIDISKKAIEVAKKNSNNFGLDKRSKFFTRSLDNIYNYKFDLIVSNPPYIKTIDIKNLSDDVRKFEPKIALDGGKDGLDVIKKVIYKSKTILKKLGLLALEIGYGQHYKVSQILKEQGFRENFLVKDYRNNIRCILARF